MSIVTAFDAETHTYTIGGRRVSSVTEVLRDLLPGWQTSEWHMQRGRAVHACAAFIARDISFDFDPAINGHVIALRKFFAEIAPIVIDVEKPVYSRIYQYAGTPDLIAKVQNKIMVIDYKAALTGIVSLQLAAYALAHPLHPRWGLGVEIHDDATYKLSEIYDLKPYQQEWLALLMTYRIRWRCGITQKREED